MAEVKRKYDLRPRIQLVVQSDYELTKYSPKEKPLSKELIEAISEKSSFRSSKPNGLQHSKKSPVPLKRALSIELLVQLSLLYHHLTLDMSLVSERFPCLYLKLLKFQPIEANLLIFGSHERKLMSLIFRMIHHWSFWAPLGWQRWNYSPYLYHIVGAGSIFAQLSVGLRGFLFANAQSSGKVGSGSSQAIQRPILFWL